MSSNPYDEIIPAFGVSPSPAQPQQPAPAANPYDDIIAPERARQMAQMKATVSLSADANPEAIAAQRQLAKYAGFKPAVGEAAPDEVKRLATIKRVTDDTANSPALQRAYSDEEFARIGHDDSGALSAVAEAVKYLFSAPGTRNNLMGDIGAGFQDKARGAAGTLQAATEVFAPVLDILENFPEIGGNPLRRLAEGFAMSGADAQAAAKALSPPTAGVVAGGVSSGVRSLVNNTLSLPMALLNPTAALYDMAAGQGGQSYQDAREAGLSPLTSLPFAASQAVIEYATEKIPMHKLIGDIADNATVIQTLKHQLASEIPGEQVATALQDMNEWAVLPENKDKTFADYLADRPAAAAQTLIATIIGIGGNVALTKTLQAVGDGAVARQAQIAQAEHDSTALTDLFKRALDSKVRTREPEAFADVVQRVAEESPGAPQSVYVDARRLTEALQANPEAAAVFNQMPEEVRSQVQEALATGGAVEIPIGELTARATGTPLEQALLPHLRTSEFGLSPTEAKESAAESETLLQQHADRVLAESERGDQMRSEGEQVRQHVADALNAVGRNTKDVNDAYARLHEAFFTAMADRMGMTPMELFKAYDLKVQGETGERPSVAPARGKLSSKARDLQSRLVLVARAAFSDNGNVDAVGDQPAKDNTASTSPQSGGNLLEADALGSKENSLVGVPSLAAMFTEMRRAVLDDPKILRAIVSTIPVDVVNNLAGSKAAAERLLRDHPMFKDGLAFDADVAVAGALGDAPDPVLLLVREAAIEAAKVSGVSLGPALKASKGRSTLGASEGDSLSQGSLQQGPNATFDPSTNTIRLLQSANLTSFLHESGHFFLEVLSDLASQENAPQQIKDDWAATLKWFGVKGDKEAGTTPQQAWAAMSLDEKRPHHERWAESFEQFLLEGKAPSLELRPVFQRFRSFLLQVYRSLKDFVAARRGTVGGAGGVFEQASEQTDTPEFRRWFGDSKVVDSDGKPLVVYHGTASDFSEFKTSKYENGIYFTPSLPYAEGRGRVAALMARGREAGGENVMPVYLRMENPAPVGYGVDRAKAEGFDGLVRGEGNMKEYVVFKPEQIKSAIGNSGAFDPANPSILAQGRSDSNPLGLTAEIRAIFDRLLATEDQIAQAEDQARYEAVYRTAEEAGMDEHEWAVYHEMHQAGTEAAMDKLQARSMADMKWAAEAHSKALKREQAKVKAIRDAMREQVAAEVLASPLEQARHEVRETKKAGGEVNLDFIAERHGYSSGDELAQDMMEQPRAKDLIDAITEQRLMAEHGDLNSPQRIQRAANEAVHNEARGRFVATELAAMQAAMSQTEKAGTTRAGKPLGVNVMVKAAKEFAKAITARRKISDLKPGRHTSAEARATKAVQKALMAGKTEEAVAAQRDRLLNLYAARETMRAQDEVGRGVDYLRKFDREGVRKSLDRDYLDQIDALLERYDLRAATSQTEIERRKSLAEWIKTQTDVGIDPDIPQHLIDNSRLTSYKSVTVEEFRGLVTTVKQIEHLARLKHKLLTAKDQREYEAVRSEIAKSVNDHAQGRVADDRTPTTNMGRWLQGIRNFGAAHIKAATWARILDGGKDGGPVWEYIIRPANAAGDMETKMRAEATEALHKIIDPWLKGGKPGGKGQFFPTIKRSLNRESILAIALNTGNAGNMQRLLGGEGWSGQQLAPVLDTLTKEDWQTVQAVWDYFETYRPLIGAKQMRVYGTEPDWVAPVGREVMTADGEKVKLRGGYYPIKYDPAASVRAEEHADADGAKRLLQGAYGAATTRRSFTKTRVEEVNGRPLIYTMAGLYSGVNDVIHDLAWHEWLIDVNRLLKSQTIDEAIRSHYGPAAVRQFKTWRDAVAEGDSGAQEAMDGALSRLRQGISVAGLGFNVMSAVMQPLGMTQSIVRVGARWIGVGMKQYIANPLKATKSVQAQSEFMASRARTRFRELNELRNSVQGQTAVKSAITQSAYFLMMQCQQMVDVPTWLGAYERAISEGNADDRSVALADQAVIDAQGGGQTKDLSAIERGGPAQKLFTTFYSFMNTALNLGVGQTMAADTTPKARAKLAADYLLIYTVPAVLGALLKDALTPGDSGDGDDWQKLVKKLLGEQLTFLLGLMVVAREFGEAGKTLFGLSDHPRDYQGPAGTRMVSDTATAAKQINQGEFDDQLRKALVNLVGDLMGLPAAQINRTVTGIEALKEGKTENPGAILFGFQEPH